MTEKQIDNEVLKAIGPHEAVTIRELAERVPPPLVLPLELRESVWRLLGRRELVLNPDMRVARA